MLIKNLLQRIIKTYDRQGFSLAELMVAVAIMLILATIGTSTYSAQLKRGRDQQRKSDIAKIQAALEEYYAINGEYPPDGTSCDSSIGSCSSACPCSTVAGSWNSAGGLLQLVTNSENIQYIDELPVDPANNAKYFYTYEVSAAGDNDRYCDGFEYTCKGYAKNCMYELTARLETDTDLFCVVSNQTTSALKTQ